jgi:WD40 repeat protein
VLIPVYAVAYTKEFMVDIYETNGSQDMEKWKLNGVLTEHILPVLALKWSKKNELLTCGADINSYVFAYNAQAKKWKGGLINITGNGMRALTACDWNNEGDRLAIGSGTGYIYVGYFNTANNQWDTIPIQGRLKNKTSWLEYYHQHKVQSC